MATADLPTSTAGIARRSDRAENLFFSGMALLLLATVLVGFARTYFLAGMLHAPLPSLIIHIHAVVFSTWILLLIAQVSLVSADRVDIHRRLGLAGFGLACLMVVVGLLAAGDAVSRNFAPPGAGLDPETFFVVPITDILVFATFIFFGYRARFKPASHKRLMLIATIAIMDAPTGRPPFTPITHIPHLDSVFCWFFLLLVAAYDFWSTRRVHRVTLWATAFLLFVDFIRIPVGGTASWHSLAAWVQTFGGWAH